jgi:hypothetical protein
MKQIQTIKCTHVDAQVSLGFYDAEGNLVREEAFPQSAGSLQVARLFHPHEEQLGFLIRMCVQQAWEEINAGAPAESPPSAPPPHVGAVVDDGAAVIEGSSARG